MILSTVAIGQDFVIDYAIGRVEEWARETPECKWVTL